jgi:hypothetical protein
MATKLNILDAVSEYRKRLANYLLQYCSKFHNNKKRLMDEYEQGLYDAYKHSRAIVEFDPAELESNLLEMSGIIEYDKLKSYLSLSFIHFLNENRSPGKKYLSDTECEDIEEGFRTQDWPKLLGYLHKYYNNTRKASR